MKTQDKLKLSLLALFVAAGLAGCDKKPGPAESAGRQIDQTVSNTGKSIDNAAGKVSDKMSDQSAQAGVAISDAEITAKVKAAIFSEPGLKTLQISVETVKGVVTLTGSVITPANSDAAKSLAGAVAGVSTVDNRLVIKPKHD